MSVPHAEVLARELARSQTAWRVFDSEAEACAWAERLARSAPGGGGAQAAAEATGVASTTGAVGVTWARALVAETGSVVLPGRDAAPRRDSLLVQHHVVLVRAEDIYPDLEAFLEALPAERLHQEIGSHLTLITGPSRTADIEKVLVMPAHGPARVSIGIVATRVLSPRGRGG